MGYHFNKFAQFLSIIVLLACISCKEDSVTTDQEQDDEPKTDQTPDPFEKIVVEAKNFEFSENYWWPEQKSPGKVITCQVAHNNYPERILAESLAGLAAKAVNEAKNDEMIWIAVGTPAADEWLNRTISRLAITERQTMNVWQLLNHMSEKGLVKGYVVYDYDQGAGDMYTIRNDMDNSANIATTIAGLINAVVVDRSMVSKVHDAQLLELFDASCGVSYRDVYQHLKSAINHNLIMMVDPKAPHHRDIAVAHSCMVIDSGTNGDMDYFFGKMKLSSPLLGWGFGDEFNFTSRASKAGMITTASNWCWNLPLLSANSQDYQPKKVKSLHPKEIDWEKDGHFHSFIMSDGDNMQWMELNFTHHTDYWANTNNGAFPFGWGTCAGQMAEMFPVTLDYMAETQPDNITIIEYGGGYHYPDLMGERTNKELALRTHARKVNFHMQKTGVKVFGFICNDLDSPEAKNAYQIYAEELQDLTGMIAVQFNPYEGGNGEVHWATDSKGMHIPIVTAKYSLWANLNNLRAGGPEKISNLINQEAAAAETNHEVANSWTIVHAWSEFANEKGQKARGLTPVKWTVDKLNENVTVINTEEMLWRIRMKHYPNEVQQLINIQ